MTAQFKSFLSDLSNNDSIKNCIEQETDVTHKELFDWIKKARRLYLTATLKGQELPQGELDDIQEQLKDLVLFLESFIVDEMVDNEKALSSEFDNHFVLLGMIFEYLGDFQPILVTKLEAYNWYLHSSLCYSLGNSPANSIVLANKFEDNNQIDPKLTEFEPAQYLEIAKKCTLLFLTRSMHIAKRLATELSAWNKDVVSFREEQNPIFVETVKGYVDLVEFVQQASSYMLTGEQESKESAREHLKDALNIFVKGFCSFESLLADRLIFIFEQMIDRSIWVKLDILNNKRPEYLKALVTQRHPVTELWPSQIAALEQSSDGHNFGILGDAQRHFVISMPTSAGKTRIAEIVIVDSINPTKRNMTCVYVVPTKALVNQVANDLSVLLEDVGYRIGTAAGSYENIPGLENVLIEDVHILVTTPEKLDMLDRSNNVAVRNCKLYIFDECHKLEDAGRGLRLEILISRLKQKNQGQHGARFVLLSAVLPHTNLGEFVAWLGAEKAIDFVWRPTRLLEGVVYIDKETGNKIVDKRTERPRKELFYGVEYPTLFSLEKLVKGVYYAAYKGKKAKESHTRWNIATELALVYAGMGSVLIYCPTRKRAQKFALDMLEESKYKRRIPQAASSEVISRRIDLANFIEERTMKGFPLAEMVKNGIAYHHAYLPTDIKKALEVAIKKGDISIISATTTLAEGLNTPVKTVIFADVIRDRYNKDNPYKRKLMFQVDPKQFRNIAGRAGRALYDTEGHTILIDFHTIYELFNNQKYSLDEFSVVSSFREVLDRRFSEVLQSGELNTTLQEFYLGSDATSNSPVRSRFFDLIGMVRSLNQDTDNQQFEQDEGLLLNEDKKKLAEEERFFQSGILALVCEQENITSETNLEESTLAKISESGIQNTLFAHQAKGADTILQDAIKYTNRQARFVSSRVDNLTRQVYNRTGLSLRSCVQLDKFIQEFIQQEIVNGEESLLSGWRDSNGQLLVDRIRGFLGCVEIAIETRPEELREIEIKTSHQDVLCDWITGKELVEIVERNFQIKPSEQSTASEEKDDDADVSDKYALMLEATNYIYSNVVTFSSWALGAACTLMQYRAEKMNVQINPEVWLLPAYTLYGVDSPIACFCIAMGIDDRDVALTLAEKCPTNQIIQTYTNTPIWENVKWWFGNINKLSLESWLNSPRKVNLAWEAIRKAKKKFNLPEAEKYRNYLFSCNLRGLIYEERIELIKEVYIGYALKLVREDNEFDKNAIRAELEDGRLLGYIPRELAEVYAPMMNDGNVLYAQVRAITTSDVDVYVFRINE